MKLFDLHCDTATRLLNEKQGLYQNSFHVSISKSKYLENYAQLMAVWSHYKLSDSEAYSVFFKVVDNLAKEVEINKNFVGLAKSSDDISLLLSQGKSPLILAMEDARILENDISRLDILHKLGVRALTLNWAGITCIGGAHDTSIGLTDFGTDVVKKCFDIGIIPDISHSSFEGASMTLEIAEQYQKPIIASHSDSYSVNPHTRNLRDTDFLKIKSLGGLVGINLCTSHLSSKENVDINDVMNHIEHYLSLGGEDCLAMGCDLDGTDLPIGFSGVSDIYKIAEEMQKLNYSDTLINKILFENAHNFFIKNI